MEILIVLYLFIVGACMGSFVGAVAWRLEKGRDIVKERSECEHCHHTLGILDLLPVASWLWLQGRCRYCRKPIGKTPILLEISLGAVFAITYLLWPYQLMSAFDWTVLGIWLVSLVAMAILFVYDLRHFLLPNVVVYPLIVIGVALFVLRSVSTELTLGQSALELILALLPVTGVYGVLYVVSGGKWIGFGDVKLGIFIGLALGWQAALGVLLLANIIGTFWIIPGMLAGKLTRNDHIPFGPFLLVATWLMLLFGPQLIALYTNLLTI